MKVLQKLKGLIVLAGAFACVTALLAKEVTPEQARTAAGNWIKLGSTRMDSEFRSSGVKSMKTVRSDTGRAIYHAVNLDGGGFVVTTGDTRLPPIIAFSAEGQFSDDETRPFHALLLKSLSRAVSSLERSDHMAAASSGGAKAGENPYAGAMAEWDELLPAEAPVSDDSRMAKAGGSRKTSLSDVRVAKMLKTEWGQVGDYSWNASKYRYDYYTVFNYYTPENYPCGCVATAGAQVMNYWKMPKSSIPQFSNACVVDGETVTRQSIAGTFDWDNMFNVWDQDAPVPSADKRKAVGKLAYNVAVAVGTKWGRGFGAADPSVLVAAMNARFGYASGTFVWYEIGALNSGAEKPSDFTQRQADFYNALYASLDAKMPVVMAIKSNASGHAIVADGYGYTGGKRYTHLNFGWYGGDDAWYYLVNESLLTDDGDKYTVFQGMGFNIHPTATGDVISGRILAASGAVASGTTVKLYDSSNKEKASATTDAKGIYSFRITAAGNYTVKAACSSGETTSQSVSVPALSRGGSFDTDHSYGWAGWTGNRSGVDLTLPRPKYVVTFNPNGGSVGEKTRTVTEGSPVGTLPTPTRSGDWAFTGWWTAEVGGKPISASTTIGATVTYYAHWKSTSVVKIDAGKYWKASLDTFFDVPTDGTVYSVKALGLPAGLKLKYNAAVKDKKGKVVTKAKSSWWVEGVPTSATEFKKNPPYMVITAYGSTKTVPLSIEVVAQTVTALDELALGQSLNAVGYLDGVGAGWTVSGLPAGLKYTAKALKKPKVAAYSVYGKTTKAGQYTITAKKKKGAFYETLKFKVLVRPKAVDSSVFGSLADRETTAHDAPVLWDLNAELGGGVTKVTGLPAGLAFAAKDTYKDKKKTILKQTGQTIAGTPTKPGTYVVTFTKSVKNGKKTVAKTAQILWTIKPNTYYTPALTFNTAGGRVVENTIGLRYNGSDLMAFTASDGATVTASGLPKGIALVDLGGGRWGFKGYATKTGTYLVTVKATMKGMTVTQRVALKANALPGWSRGSFPGYVRNASGEIKGMATMSVTSAGKVSGKFKEGGKTWTFSASCYTGTDGSTFYSVPVTAKYSYKVKSGKKTVKMTDTREFLFKVAKGSYGGDVTLTEDGGGSTVYGQQNLWGSTYKTVGTKLFYTSKKAPYKTFKQNVVVDGATCSLALKITSAGKVTATLTWNTGKKSKGKVVYYKPTCSTAVWPNSAADPKTFTGLVYFYFPASSSNKFPEYSDFVEVGN